MSFITLYSPLVLPLAHPHELNMEIHMCARVLFVGAQFGNHTIGNEWVGE
jgi:hypothetical protein